MEVKVDLGRDAFEICYDAGSLTGEGIERVIRALGFRPRQAQPQDLVAAEPSGNLGEAPSPVAQALSRARDEGRSLVIDFFADWCGPCKVLEDTILPHPRVQEALRQYILLRVDADEYPRTVEYYRIDAMPTLLALDGAGKELRRFEGLPDPEELAAQLAAAHEAETAREGTVRR